jgi:hypothetical protein
MRELVLSHLKKVNINAQFGVGGGVILLGPPATAPSQSFKSKLSAPPPPKQPGDKATLNKKR